MRSAIEAEHFDVSLRMAEAALLPAVRDANADTVIVADGTSCRHQIHDGTRAHAHNTSHACSRRRFNGYSDPSVRLSSTAVAHAAGDTVSYVTSAPPAVVNSRFQIVPKPGMRTQNSALNRYLRTDHHVPHRSRRATA